MSRAPIILFSLGKHTLCDLGEYIYIYIYIYIYTKTTYKTYMYIYVYIYMKTTYKNENNLYIDENNLQQKDNLSALKIHVPLGVGGLVTGTKNVL